MSINIGVGVGVSLEEDLTKSSKGKSSNPKQITDYDPLTDPNGFEWWDGRTSVTVTGSGVSSWLGRLLGLDLTQGTDAARPTYSNPIITFDGVDDELGPLTYSAAQEQPISYYIVLKQNTWTESDMIFDGGPNNNRNSLRQQPASGGGVSPELGMYAGGSGGIAANSDLALDTWGVVCAIFDGDSSKLIVDDGTATLGGSGAPGSNNMPGFILGARATGNWSNIQVQQVLILNEASDAAKVTEVTAFLQSITA